MARKSNAGRPTKYKPEICGELIRFFDIPPYVPITQTEIGKDGEAIETDTGKLRPNELPLFQDFAAKIGVCVDTLHEWKKQHPEFSEAYKKAQQYQERNWIQCSLLGLYSPAFTIFMGKNVFGWKDKQEHEHSGGIKADVTIKFVSPDADNG